MNKLLGALALALPWATSPAAAAPLTENVRIENPSNTSYNGHRFGIDTALSPDGQTLAVGDNYATGAGAVYVYTRSDAGWGSPKRLDLPAGNGSAAFGGSVAMTNDVLVVGAPNLHVPDFPARGSAFVYRRIGADWILEQELVPPVPAVFQAYGIAVAIDGDTIFVGSDNPGAVYVYERGAALWTEQQVLEPSDGNTYTFGHSIDIDGDRAVVGAPLQWINGAVQRGGAYTFLRTAEGWVADGKILASDGAAWDEFGRAVAIEGDMIVVGAPGWGAAYVFLHDGFWFQQFILDAGHGGDSFGASIEIEDRAILIGARYQFGSQPGRAYYYEPSGFAWALSQTLVPDGSQLFDHFGDSVALSGDQFVLGGLDAEIEGRDAHGIVAAFSRQLGAWIETEQLYVSDGAPYAQFGTRVALDGDVLVIGTPGDDNQGISGHGAAYVHVRTTEGWQLRQVLADSCGGRGFGGRGLLVAGDLIAVAGTCDGVPGGAVSIYRFDGDDWALEQVLRASDAAVDDLFGTALALDGNTLVIGAYLSSHDGERGGAAYVFEYAGGTWSEVQRLLPADSTGSDQFGFSVAIDGSLIAIGAQGKWFGANDHQGAVYLFAHDGSQWQQQRKIVAPDGGQNDYLGSSVTFTAGDLAAGASGENGGAGAIYLFDPATGLVKQKLTVAGTQSPDQLGHSIAATDELLVAPCAQQIVGENWLQGSVYVFVRGANSWTLRTQLLASDGGPAQFFGWGVAISADRAVVGAPQANNRNGAGAGRAYVFDGLPPPPVVAPPPPPPPVDPSEPAPGDGGPMPLAMAFFALAALWRRLGGGPLKP